MNNFKKIESKWQKAWAKNSYKLWHAEKDAKKKKMYVLEMFPYPSGDGLHVGHVESFTAADIMSRYYRMKGLNVIHPMGWDAFGLPAENYAIKRKVHPSAVVSKNVKNFKKQLNSLGFSYDWQREIDTTDPNYYKWTQWIFLQLFKEGLAYEADVPVNWCPSCKTVLANEEVVDGHCDRCDSVAERKNLKQWILKITAYADRLLKDLAVLDWPEKVKEMQKNWIGRSEGAEIEFPIANSSLKIKIFTTRPDTVPGVTYLVIAPEHSLIEKLSARITNLNDVREYAEKSKNKSDRERVAETKNKSGAELKGIKAINPLNGREVPIFASDYVLASYGTGAIMAVPAHDQRDFEFAEKFKIPIIQVISKTGKEENLKSAYIGDGIMINAGEFSGLGSQKAGELVIEKLGGTKKVNYKLRDWIFSRQRYWGEPIPIIKCPKCGNVSVPEKDLPVILPKVKNYEPTGRAESPLAAIEKWVNVKCPVCGEPAKRETNTMPQWAGSCWYYLRYADPKNNQEIISKEEESYWLEAENKEKGGVDLYIGGLEHAVLHLLYARFWHKFLFDIGVVSAKEPFQKLVNQGMILGSDGQKMSKSRGNVVNPDEIIGEFGADALRLYEMFMGPLEDAKPWDTKGIVGLERFLNRVFVLFGAGKKRNYADKTDEKFEKLLHKTIKKVTEDIESFRFNTAISALMILLNEFEKEKEKLSVGQAEGFLKLLFPFAPHAAQELWEKNGFNGFMDFENWPEYEEKMLAEGEFEMVVQINGKFRDKITVRSGVGQEEAEKLALSLPKIKEIMGSNRAKKIIFVSGRLINIVL